MKILMLNLYFFAAKKWRLKIIVMISFIFAALNVASQNYSNDTCVLLSKSTIINSGMAKTYTNTNEPVKSILIDNRKWIFDSIGRIIEELNFNLIDRGVIDRRKTIEYDQTEQIKSISLYERSSLDEKMPTTITNQELYNWNNDTFTLVELKDSDTVRFVLEIINENGCVEFSRAQHGIFVTETQYEYNLLGLQRVRRYKQWKNNILKIAFKSKLFYENSILSSMTSIDLITGKKRLDRNYHLEGGELKGYSMSFSDLRDSTHTSSFNEIGEVIFRQYDDWAFYLTESTEDGVRYQDKRFSYDDGTRRVDRYEISNNGDVVITSIVDDEQQSRTTKKQTKDDHGNWIKLVTIREQLNKPPRKKIIFREIEYFED